MIRVLIVEDSVTQREIFSRLLAHDGELTVVGEASNGKEAITKAQELSPDVVLMDIHMPDMDGLTATREIMRRCPVPIVVASATLKKRDIDLAMQAYAAGAVSVIEKPSGAVLLHLQKIAPVLRHELIAASKARLRLVQTLTDGSAPSKERPPPTSGYPESLPRVDVIGVCASTGGPAVLATIFSRLPKPFPIPVLLVQHISRGFEEGFARWLTKCTDHPANLASDGQRLSPGIWLAPGGQHLTLRSPRQLDLPAGTPAEIHCPSGNPLFQSLARHTGAKAAGVLLTGMGDDGAEGLLSLRQAGGMTIIQNEASCLIWGMPKVGQQRDAARYELSPNEIAHALTQMASSPNPQSRAPSGRRDP